MKKNKIIYLLVLLILIQGVSAYDFNVSKNITLTMTPEQVWVATGLYPPQAFNSSDYSTPFIVTLNYTFNVSDVNTSCSNYLDNSTLELLNNISIELSNKTCNPDNSYSNALIDSLRNASHESLREEIITGLQGGVPLNCNLSSYNFEMSTYITGYFNANLLPNITFYNSMKDMYNTCDKDKNSCTQYLTTANQDADDLKKDNHNKNYIIYGLLAIIMLLLYLEYGGSGSDILKKIRYKRGDRKALNTTGFKPPQQEPQQDNDLVKKGSSLIEGEDHG